MVDSIPTIAVLRAAKIVLARTNAGTAELRATAVIRRITAPNDICDGEREESEEGEEGDDGN